MTDIELIKQAEQARSRAYAPYSGCRVGTALLCTDGTIYLGCNIENEAYSPSLCAERVAFAKAISEGKRNFTAIAVSGGTETEPDQNFPPCGVCRQVMAEFCTEEFRIVLGTAAKPQAFQLKELLPKAFHRKRKMYYENV